MSKRLRTEIYEELPEAVLTLQNIVRQQQADIDWLRKQVLEIRLQLSGNGDVLPSQSSSQALQVISVLPKQSSSQALQVKCEADGFERPPAPPWSNDEYTSAQWNAWENLAISHAKRQRWYGADDTCRLYKCRKQGGKRAVCNGGHLYGGLHAAALEAFYADPDNHLMPVVGAATQVA